MMIFWVGVDKNRYFLIACWSHLLSELNQVGSFLVQIFFRLDTFESLN